MAHIRKNPNLGDTETCRYRGCQAAAELGLLHSSADGKTVLMPMAQGGLCFHHAEFGKRTSNGEKLKDVLADLNMGGK